MYTCQRCQNEFNLSYKVSQSYMPKFCSKECRFPTRQLEELKKDCLFCGEPIRPKLYTSQRQFNALTYCSKRCKSLHQKGGKYNSRAQLLIDIKRLINSQGRYVPRDFICKELGVGSSTLNRWNISTVKVNRELGYKQPSSMVEELVYEYLAKLLPNSTIEREKSYEGLVGQGGRLLRYDISIDNTLLIELDDSSHWDTTHKYYNNRHKEHDYLKDVYAQQQGLKLLRVQFKSLKDDLATMKTRVYNFLQTQGYSL